MSEFAWRHTSPEESHLVIGSYVASIIKEVYGESCQTEWTVRHIEMGGVPLLGVQCSGNAADDDADLRKRAIAEIEQAIIRHRAEWAVDHATFDRRTLFEAASLAGILARKEMLDDNTLIHNVKRLGTLFAGDAK